MRQVARKGADELKEERALHRFWSWVWVATEVFCYNCSKQGENYGEFVNESRKDVMGSLELGSPLRQQKAPARWCRS